jgi:hypothetical protein
VNTLNKLALAATTTAALGAALSTTAYAGISLQGPLLTGIAVQSLESHQLAVTTVTLPGGKTIDLHAQTTD